MDRDTYFDRGTQFDEADEEVGARPSHREWREQAAIVVRPRRPRRSKSQIVCMAAIAGIAVVAALGAAGQLSTLALVVSTGVLTIALLASWGFWIMDNVIGL